MPKKFSGEYKQKSLVSGMKIDDILNMDAETFGKLSKADMQKVVGRLVSAANKRLRRIEAAGASTPASKAVERSGGNFSTKGKTLNQLRAEYTRAKTFLGNKSSTISGYKKIKKETAKQLKAQGVEVEPAQLDNIFEIYEKLKERDPGIAERNMKYRVLNEIKEQIDNVDPDELIDFLDQRLSAIYEEEMEKMNDDNGVSAFFEIE